MSNMSYCRFENTLRDLRDCDETLEEIDGDFSQLSETEARAAKQMIALCKKIGELKEQTK